MTITLFALIALYLIAGIAVKNKAMAHVRANALTDPDFFGMVIQDQRPSLSMTLPKLTVVLFWMPILLALALIGQLNRQPATA
jgi:hypothetical protein